MKQFKIHNRIFRFKSLPYVQYFCVDTLCDYNLNVHEVSYVRLEPNGKLPSDWAYRIQTTEDIDDIESRVLLNPNLNGPYEPAADLPTLNTIIPDSFDNAQREAFKNFKKAVGNVDEYVCAKLKMSYDDMREALKAEQVDGVGLAIYNIEERHQSLIIGDQTGIGKGRQAAGVMRYALANGMTPVFITANSFLFSDMYRDCKALGIDKGEYGVSPLIFNKDGEIVDFSHKISDIEVDYEQGEDETDNEYAKRIVEEMKAAYETVHYHAEDEDFRRDYTLPKNRNAIFATYSQFSASKPPKRGVDKKGWFMSFAAKNRFIFIFDEAHKAAGATSNVGEFFANAMSRAEGCLFLSATFSKNKDTLAFFAAKTVISESRIDRKQLANVLNYGGDMLHEIVSTELVKNGQLLRRERRTEGSFAHTITSSKEDEEKYGLKIDKVNNRAIADKITEVLRNLIKWASIYFNEEKIFKAEYHRLKTVANEKDFVIGRIDFKSPINQIANISRSLILALKANVVADRTIWHIKHGHKVVIALANTNEVLLRDDNNMPLKEDMKMTGDFSSYLLRVINGMKYATIQLVFKKDAQINEDALAKMGYVREMKGGEPTNIFKCKYSLVESTAAADNLNRIEAEVKRTNYNIPCSPIDAIVYRLKKHGIDSIELTNRKSCLVYSDSNYTQGVVSKRTKTPVSLATTKFQNNNCDVLIINQSAATGMSIHAVPTESVPESEVKQRFMIIAQSEGDINLEVQKMGRIDRTGQLANIPPQYEYINTGVPVEERLQLMMKAKLDTLFATTSADRHSKDDFIKSKIVDICNKYGDDVVKKWLDRHYDIVRALDMKASISRSKKDLATKATARIFFLPCEEQDFFWNDIIGAYEAEKERLIKEEKWDLEVIEDTKVCELQPYSKPAAIICGCSSFAEDVTSGMLLTKIEQANSFEYLKTLYEHKKTSYDEEGKNLWEFTEEINDILNSPEKYTNAKGEYYDFDYWRSDDAIDIFKFAQELKTKGPIIYNFAREEGVKHARAILSIKAKKSWTGTTFNVYSVRYDSKSIDESIVDFDKNIYIRARDLRRCIMEYYESGFFYTDPRARELWESPQYNSKGVLAGNMFVTFANRDVSSVRRAKLASGETILYVGAGSIEPQSLYFYTYPLSSSMYDFLTYGSDLEVITPRGNRFNFTANKSTRLALIELTENDETIKEIEDIKFITGVTPNKAEESSKVVKFILNEAQLDKLGDKDYVIKHNGSSDSVNFEVYQQHVKNLAKKELWPKVSFERYEVPANKRTSITPKQAEDLQAKAEAEAAKVKSARKPRKDSIKPRSQAPDANNFDDDEAPAKKKALNMSLLDDFDDEAPAKKKALNMSLLDDFDDEAPAKKKGKKSN